MNYSISVVSRSAIIIPFSLADAKRELDVTTADDDALIDAHIRSAVSWVEQYTNRFLVPVVIDLFTDKLDGILRLPYGPITGITSILVDGVAVVAFRAIGGYPYAVQPPLNQSWPFTANGMGSTVVRYSAGYAAGAVPEGVIGAIRQILSIHYDKTVGAELESQWKSIERILSPFKIRGI